jgi:hypothetical protein
MSEASAMDLDDGIPFAGLLVPDTDAVDPRVRHCAPPVVPPIGWLCKGANQKQSRHAADFRPAARLATVKRSLTLKS